MTERRINCIVLISEAVHPCNYVLAGQEKKTASIFTRGKFCQSRNYFVHNPIFGPSPLVMVCIWDKKQS